MMRATSRISSATSQFLTATILLLQLLSLVCPAQSYPGDIPHKQLPRQLVRGRPGVPGLIEKNQFSPHAFSLRNKRDHGLGGGVAPKVEGEFEEVAAEECKGMGLEKCGDLCVAQCCNAESALACPVNSYCTANNEYEFCCENGHTCDEPVECLNLDDSRCEDHAGELVMDDGEERACCYMGFEVCMTIWDGFPACMPTGAVEIPPKPTKHTHTGSFDPDAAKITETMRGGNVPGPTITAQTDIADDSEDDTEENEFTDVDKDGVDDDEDPNATYPNYSGTGAMVGGVVGGVIGLAIVGACVFFTGRHYRRKRKEEKEKEAQAALDDGRDDDATVMGISGVGTSGPPSSRSWERWVGSPKMGPSSPRMSSSWSNPTLTDTPLSHRSPEVVVMGKVVGDRDSDQADGIKEPRSPETEPSPRRRSYTVDSGVAPEIIAVPPAAAIISPGVSRPRERPFDWRSCQTLPTTPTSPRSSRIGSRLNSPASTIAPKSPRLSPRMDSPSMIPPRSPRLEGRLTTMSGAL